MTIASRPPAAPSAAVRSRLRRQRQRDTAPELALRKALHALGLRYYVDRPVLPGLRRRADVVFPRKRVAVFLDGCYWHGCPDHGTTPRNNRAWWREKLAANQRRDRDTDERLRVAGWTVIRIWEHEDPVEAARRVMEAVRRTTSAEPSSPQR